MGIFLSVTSVYCSFAVPDYLKKPFSSKPSVRPTGEIHTNGCNQVRAK
jgi:hypothetical protein